MWYSPTQRMNEWGRDSVKNTCADQTTLRAQGKRERNEGGKGYPHNTWLNNSHSPHFTKHDDGKLHYSTHTLTSGTVGYSSELQRIPPNQSTIRNPAWCCKLSTSTNSLNKPINNPIIASTHTYTQQIVAVPTSRLPSGTQPERSRAE